MDLEHHYGPNVCLPDDPFLFSLLARIGSPDTSSIELTPLMRSAFGYLCAKILGREFPVVQGRAVSRMAASEPRAYYQGPMLCPKTKLVLCAIIRAGILAAQTCYESACEVLPPSNVRLDFLNMSRTTDECGQVTGVRFDGSKIGGPVEDAVVIIADPMGATGGTVARAVEIYKEFEGGAPKKIIAAHLMVTPEAVQRLTASFPELLIYSCRLDRGLSPDEVLKTAPGTHKDLERGLNNTQYIVPGAGGIGELLSNSWI